MRASDELRAWIAARATTSDDAAQAVGFVAAYVAEAAKDDRFLQDGEKMRPLKIITRVFRDLLRAG